MTARKGGLPPRRKELFDCSYGDFSRGCCGPIFDFAALSRDYNTYASGYRIDHDG